MLDKKIELLNALLNCMHTVLDTVEYYAQLALVLVYFTTGTLLLYLFAKFYLSHMRMVYFSRALTGTCTTLYHHHRVCICIVRVQIVSYWSARSTDYQALTMNIDLILYSMYSTY